MQDLTSCFVLITNACFLTTIKPFLFTLMTNSKRTKKKPNKSNQNSLRLDRVAGKELSFLRMLGKDGLRAKIFKLKMNTPRTDQFILFSKIFKDNNYLDRVHGAAFPTKLSELFSKPALYLPVHPLSEIVWAVCRCLQFSEELRDFTRLRDEYEHYLLLNSKSKCYEILDEIERRFGSSVWLLQNKLSAAQFWGGIDETRKLVQAYRDECKSNPLITIIIKFISKRIEATGLKGYLNSELSRMFEGRENPKLEIYLRAKVFELPNNINTDDVPAILWKEAQSCVIDYYETLVFVLQSLARHQAIPVELISHIEKPLTTIFKRTQDGRFNGIMRGIGIVPNITIVYHEKRAELIEAYTKGEYAIMVAESNEYLNNSPEDISIQVMRLKACIRGDLSYPEQHGILKEAFEKLQVVLNASKNTYSAAYELITLSERFYGHSWVHCLRDVVLYELRREQSTFPPQQLRDIFVREPFLSPFSAVAANGDAKTCILNDEHLKKLFPYTREVYDIVTTGKTNRNLSACEVRKQKYLAMYHLAFDSPAQAIEYFNWLIENTNGSEYLRSSGGAALAFLKLGQIREAADTIVTAYVKNQNAPGILPIVQVVDVLNVPTSWPDTISIPLLFHLYATYCDNERLAHLRYAFERFQENHIIQEPSDIKQYIDAFGKSLVIAYLKGVWIPEIMRQTILYCGTKEIEEARIKVCRLLADLDPENASEYLDEIKGRVKQLEIAKGITLIEQSKVYVEIEAIKKVLKSKLSDSYSRYKSTSQTLLSEQDLSDYKKITEVASDVADKEGISIPSVLSLMYTITDDKGSESDVQFEALYSEITNEFLRGNHGLNAYLSTRVRHGKLSNTLRKPVTDEGLVTSRKEDGTSYIRNQNWKPPQAINNVHHDDWETVLDALDRFSSEFDSVIDYIKDDLIQIKIIHNLEDKNENSNALFIYRSSSLERQFVQEHDKNFNNMDDFVSYCINILWEKTDANLTTVQHVLNKKIRERLMRPFDTLTNHLNQISVQGVNDLLNAVARAKTNTQTKLNNVISWFKRSEVYDRQDYLADFPFHIALNMVKNTISSATEWSGASISCNNSESLMIGRTLDGMADVFYVLLENAILRSGLEVDKLIFEAEVSFSDGFFNAKISNNISTVALTQDERDKLETLRESLRNDDSSRRAQGEGRSGLLKIWLTINSPIYKDPKLDFNYLDDEFFVVEVSFKLERLDNEYINY